MTEPLLSDEERAALRKALSEQLLAQMFGDGMEDEYVRNGFPQFKGVDNMSDLELLVELGHYDPDVDKTPVQMAEAWRRELAE